MDSFTIQILESIRKKYTGKGYGGKIFQKLLALSFIRKGFKLNEERTVEGVDIDIIKGVEKYALEVKTTVKDEIQLGKKDVEGLRRREPDGYRTGYAVLKLGILSEWIIGESKNIRVGTLRIGRLSVYPMQNLEDCANEEFPKVVKKYGRNILLKNPSRVLSYIDEVIEKEQKEILYNEEKNGDSSH